MSEGKIIKQISDTYFVLSDNKVYNCRARGKFRNNLVKPLVGDRCHFDKEKNYLLDILPRKNSLKRPPIANVDAALIITSVKQPNLNLSLLDKQLALVKNENIEPIIIITKMDLLTKDEKKRIKEIIKMYKSIGFKVFKNTSLFPIKRALKNKIVVLTGQTGAGKSSLLNKLGNFNIETNPISKKLGRGVHTTRHTETFKVGKAYISDTPGFSSLDLNIDKNLLKRCYPEFNVECKFKDCNHIKEKGCTVKAMLKEGKIFQSRYDNYVRLWEELK